MELGMIDHLDLSLASFEVDGEVRMKCGLSVWTVEAGLAVPLFPTLPRFLQDCGAALERSRPDAPRMWQR
jgi:hypothetical protein